MKIYLIAYGCEPHQGGEHQVGWKLANYLNDSCELEVVTRISNKKLIEENNNKNINFTFIENDLGMKFKPKGKFSYFYYLFWQISTYNYLKRTVNKDDIVHYVTFGNIHLPQFLFLLKSKLVIGPMGGGSLVDYKMMRNSSTKLKMKSIVHKFINFTAKVNPIYLYTYYKSNKIILRTNETKCLIPKIFHQKCEIFLETGIETENITFVQKERKLNKVITTARIIESKNINQVIEVFNYLNNHYNNDLELLIIGDGPEKKILEKKNKENLSVKFLGKVSHEKINDYLQSSDLFLFCSIKEGGSHSLFEAAINNLPIACYSISGMTVFPSNDSSIKIEPTYNIDENIKKLSEKIIEKFEKKEINEICEKSIKNLKDNYDWNQINTKIQKIYKDIK
jgi:glycosyltransferase involved in cell wall biosynthesis